MKNASFYNSLTYRRKQSIIAKENWKKGIYDFRYKREKRKCARKGCDNIFEVQQSDPKRFCSRSCFAIVNNSKRTKEIDRGKIEKMYKDGLSMMEISKKTGLEYGRIVYCMKKFNILRRSRSEATYRKRNPNGDPFKIEDIEGKRNSKLFHLGIGLYLGEGDKKNKHVVKLANSDPEILKIFLKFLQEICGIKKERIKAELNIFDDVSLEKALKFWIDSLGLKRSQLRTLTVRKSRGGSYKKKSKYGTLSIYFSNIKLKELVNSWCRQARESH